LLARERIAFRRRPKTAGKSMSLDSVVRPGVVVRLTLAFVFVMPIPLAVASVAVIVFATRPAAPWSMSQ
jgi:hypothetical protein